MGEKKTLYTVTMDPAVIRKLKTYCKVKRVLIGDVVTVGVMDYMAKNAPTDAEIEAYKQRLAQEADIDF